MAVVRPEPMTDVLSAYLELEAHAEQRHELVNGVIHAMAGASPRHSELCYQLERLIRSGVERRDCYVASRDQRVAVDLRPLPSREAPLVQGAKGTFVYPDVVLACPPEFHPGPPRTLLNPRLVVEVLSRSTPRDRADKLDAYRERVGLDDLLLVHPDRMLIEHHERAAPNQWLVTLGSGGILTLRHLSLAIDVEAAYEGVFRLPLDEDDVLSPRASGASAAES